MTVLWHRRGACASVSAAWSGPHVWRLCLTNLLLAATRRRLQECRRRGAAPGAPADEHRSYHAVRPSRTRRPAGRASEGRAHVTHEPRPRERPRATATRPGLQAVRRPTSSAHAPASCLWSFKQRSRAWRTVPPRAPCHSAAGATRCAARATRALSCLPVTLASCAPDASPLAPARGLFARHVAHVVLPSVVVGTPPNTPFLTPHPSPIDAP